MFVYELGGCKFESCCSHLFKQLYLLISWVSSRRKNCRLPEPTWIKNFWNPFFINLKLQFNCVFNIIICLNFYNNKQYHVMYRENDFFAEKNVLVLFMLNNNGGSVDLQGSPIKINTQKLILLLTSATWVPNFKTNLRNTICMTFYN